MSSERVRKMSLALEEICNAFGVRGQDFLTNVELKSKFDNIVFINKKREFSMNRILKERSVIISADCNPPGHGFLNLGSFLKVKNRLERNNRKCATLNFKCFAPLLPVPHISLFFGKFICESWCEWFVLKLTRPICNSQASNQLKAILSNPNVKSIRPLRFGNDNYANGDPNKTNNCHDANKRQQNQDVHSSGAPPLGFKGCIEKQLRDLTLTIKFQSAKNPFYIKLKCHKSGNAVNPTAEAHSLKGILAKLNTFKQLAKRGINQYTKFKMSLQTNLSEQTKQFNNITLRDFVKFGRYFRHLDGFEIAKLSRHMECMNTRLISYCGTDLVTIKRRIHNLGVSNYTIVKGLTVNNLKSFYSFWIVDINFLALNIYSIFNSSSTVVIVIGKVPDDLLRSLESRINYSRSALIQVQNNMKKYEVVSKMVKCYATKYNMQFTNQI